MESNISRITIDPRCRINYASFYIEGLRALFGASAIEFRCITELAEAPSNCMAVTVGTDNAVKRIIFDYWDGDSINENLYEWCDVYGKINLRPEDAQREKIMPLGPNFGISLWNPVKTLMMGVKNHKAIQSACGDRFRQPLRAFIRDYAYMFIRRKSHSYYHRFTEEEQDGYVFSLSTLWWGDLSINTTNRYRGEFMRLCKELMETFEGGFFYVKTAERESTAYSKYLQEYHDIIYKRRISMSEYDKRNRRSLFVFNTPSVNGCLGWKLGEYLCEGKAIISTPPNHVMPGEFINGVHYLEVNTEQEMREAILRLRNDKRLLMQLKQNAFDYYNNWVSPEVAVRRVLSRAGVTL